MSDLHEKAKEFASKYKENFISNSLQANNDSYVAGIEVGFIWGKKECEDKLRWIPIEEKLPENADEIEVRNSEWVTDFNPKGIRSGYYDKGNNPIFYSCFWNVREECYNTSNQNPTHWRYFL